MPGVGRTRVALLLWALIMPAGLAPHPAHAGGARVEPHRTSGGVRSRIRARMRARSRARVMSRERLRLAAHSLYIPEREWENHPAISRAISRYRGEQGRTVRSARFDARAVVEHGAVTGYSIQAATRGYDGKTRDTILEVDTRGRVTREHKTHTTSAQALLHPSRSAGLGPAASRVRLRAAQSALEHLPGVRWLSRRRLRRAAQRHQLIEDYAARHNLDAELADQGADRHIADVVRYSFHKDAWVYGVSDLHASTGPQNPQEDFRAGGGAMTRFLAHVNDGGKRATLVCGGDCFEFMENAPIDATDAELRAYADRFIKGHEETYKALVKAVVPHLPGEPDRGLRVVFVRGNHDIQMVSKGLRDHIVDTMTRVGGLSAADAATFRKRVAFAGDMAVLGKKGEWVMMHGDLHDPANNWREMSNPFRYKLTRGGLWNTLKTLATERRLPPLEVKRVREANLGYIIVQKFFNFVERQNPDSENQPRTAHAISHTVMSHPEDVVRMGRVLWELLRQNGTHDPTTLAMTRRNDRQAALAWAERTRVHEQWGLSGPDEVVRRLDQIRAQMPEPVHERMTSRLRLVNIVRMMLGGARRVTRERKQSEPLLIGLLTTLLPNVVDVNIGHTHVQSRAEGYVPDRGRVVYRNTGTWTNHAGKDVFTVAVSHQEGGRLTEKGLYRVDGRSGELVRQNRPPAPEWGSPAGWQPPRAERTSRDKKRARRKEARRRAADHHRRKHGRATRTASR